MNLLKPNKMSNHWKYCEEIELKYTAKGIVLAELKAKMVAQMYDVEIDYLYTDEMQSKYVVKANDLREMLQAVAKLAQLLI